MANISSSNFSPVPRVQVKYDIISAFGLDSNQAQTRPDEYTGFSKSYSTNLRQLLLRASGSSSLLINQLAARSHEDKVLCVCKALANKKHLRRADIREILRTSSNEDEDRAIDRSMDLALRLWLMINVRDDELSINEPRKLSVQCADTETLQELLHRLFPTTETKLIIREARLGTKFNAAYLSDICGLEID